MRSEHIITVTNLERVGKAVELLKDGWLPFVERERGAQHGRYGITTVTANWRNELTFRADDDDPRLDVALVQRIMWEQWHETFRRPLGFAERSLISELRDHRNKWAHQDRPRHESLGHAQF